MVVYVWKKKKTLKRWKDFSFFPSLFLVLSHLTNSTQKKTNKKGDFKNTWQPPIIASFYDGATLPLKKKGKKKKGGSQGRRGPDEGCVLDVGRELFVQTAIRLHCWGRIAVIYLETCDSVHSIRGKRLTSCERKWNKIARDPGSVLTL